MEKKERNKDYFVWKRFKDGDSEAFDWLYNRHVDELYSFGILFSKDKEFVKDCIHDLFLDLHKYRKRLSDTDSIRFYLFRSLKHLIHKKRTNFVFNDNIASEENLVSGADEAIIDEETEVENYKILAKAMDRLTQKQKEALSLRFVQNLSYDEIAQLLGISVESVRTSIYRALKTLREKIQTENPSFYLMLFLQLLSD